MAILNEAKERNEELYEENEELYFAYMKLAHEGDFKYWSELADKRLEILRRLDKALADLGEE